MMLGVLLLALCSRPYSQTRLFIIAIYAVHQTPTNRLRINMRPLSITDHSRVAEQVVLAYSRRLLKILFAVTQKKKQQKNNEKTKRRLLNHKSTGFIHYNMFRGLLPAAPLSDYDFHQSLPYEISAEAKASHFPTLQNYASERIKMCRVQ